MAAIRVREGEVYASGTPLLHASKCEVIVHGFEVSGHDAADFIFACKVKHFANNGLNVFSNVNVNGDLTASDIYTKDDVNGFFTWKEKCY